MSMREWDPALGLAGSGSVSAIGGDENFRQEFKSIFACKRVKMRTIDRAKIDRIVDGVTTSCWADFSRGSGFMSGDHSILGSNENAFFPEKISESRDV